MAQITLTATETEVFGVGVLEAYQFADFFSEDWTLFQGMTAGEVINVPVFSAIDAINLPDATDHNGSATITGVEVPLVDPVKAFVDIEMAQVDVRPDLNLIENTGRALGRAVGYGRTIRVANHMVTQADSNSNFFEVDQTDATGAARGEQFKSGIVQVAAAMDDAGIPAEDRFALLKPTQFYELRGLAEVISSDFTQGQNRNQSIGGQSSLLNYLNFDMRNAGGLFGINWLDSAHDQLFLPTASDHDMAHDSTNVIGLFWHKDSTVVRHQTGLRSAVDWIPRSQVWLAIARLHMGVRVVKTAGVYILLDSSL